MPSCYVEAVSNGSNAHTRPTAASGFFAVQKTFEPGAAVPTGAARWLLILRIALDRGIHALVNCVAYCFRRSGPSRAPVAARPRRHRDGPQNLYPRRARGWLNWSTPLLSVSSEIPLLPSLPARPMMITYLLFDFDIAAASVVRRRAARKRRERLDRQIVPSRTSSRPRPRGCCVGILCEADPVERRSRAGPPAAARFKDYVADYRAFAHDPAIVGGRPDIDGRSAHGGSGTRKVALAHRVAAKAQFRHGQAGGVLQSVGGRRTARFGCR